MKIPNHYFLVNEHPDHFEMHDARDGKRFPIAKKGLDEASKAKLSKVQKFDDGGAVEPQEFVPGQSYADAPLPGDINSEPIYPDAPSGAQELEALNNTLGITHAPNPNEPGLSDLTSGTASPAPVPASPAPASLASPTPAIPPAPAPAAAMPPDPFLTNATGENKVLKDEITALQSGAAAEGAAGSQEAKVQGDWAKTLEHMLTPAQILEKHQAQDDQLRDAYATRKIDPERYWHNKSTASKIAAGVSLIFGGMASATIGHNPALDQINKAIENDIDAQKNDQSKAMNLWKMNRESTNTEMEATEKTRNQLYAGVEAKLQQAAANAKGPMARARIAGAIADIRSKMLANNYKLALMTPSGQNGGGFVDVDPAQLVPGMVPEPRQKDVFEEIGRAQNVKVNGKKILEAFDNASHGITDPIKYGAYIDQLHQLMLPNFKSIDGTVRQAAMDESFKNTTPGRFEPESRIALKRKALQDWIHSETAAPQAKGFGLDLNRFRSTTNDPRANFDPMQTQIYNQAIQLIRSGNPALIQKGQMALQKLGVTGG